MITKRKPLGSQLLEVKFRSEKHKTGKYIAGPGIKTLKFTLDKLNPELSAQLSAEVKK